MSRARLIFALVLVLFLAALGIAWRQGTAIAFANTERVLAQSETLFVESVNDYVYSVLLHASANLHRELGKSVRALPQSKVCEIARRFGVDELNIVSRDGITVASTWGNAPGGVGYYFAAYPDTVPYLALTDGVTKVVSQPFRNGTTNPQDYSKYMGTPFADGSGFLEIAFRFARLVPAMDLNAADVVRTWKVGRTGHLAYFNDYSRFAIAADTPDGAVAQGRENGEIVFCRPFFFAGHRYLSVLPEREYFQQRNLYFAIIAPSLAAVLAFLALFFRSLSRANRAEARRRAAADEVRRRDLALARTVQLSGLEPVAKYRRSILTMTFDAVTNPAREVGGDFYDFFPVNITNMAFVIADVSGKGIPAAMFMMRARNEIANAICTHVDLAEAMAAANRRLTDNNEAEMFVTAWAGLVNIATGEVEYVNAGHNRPFVRRASGEVNLLTARGGRFMGIFPEAKYAASAFTLEPGDTLFLYTDGVTEAMDSAHRLYGNSRLAAALERSEADAGRMLGSVMADLKAFAGDAEQSDDITALALVWHGSGVRVEREFPAAAATGGEAMAWLRENIALASPAAKARLLNAADEMMVNIASYSGAITFKVSVANAPGRTRLEFTDEGREYNPLTHTDPNVHLPLAERPTGGLGILMTKKLVDFVTYRRENGVRNLLVLVKNDGALSVAG